MAVELKKSFHITNRDNAPATSTPAAKSFGLKREAVALVNIPTAASIGSKAILFEIGSGDRLSDILIKNDALTGGAVNIGLYDTTLNGGAVVSVSLFGAAQSVATAGSVAISPAVADTEKLIYELLALAIDPGKQYDVVLTFTAATSAVGNIGARMNYITF